MKKVLPKFRTEDAEREFWASHDSVGYIDWRKGKRVTLPNLKPSSQTISIRLPKPMLDRLKLLANKRDVPYQSLLKMFVAERLRPSSSPDRALASDVVASINSFGCGVRIAVEPASNIKRAAAPSFFHDG